MKPSQGTVEPGSEATSAHPLGAAFSRWLQQVLLDCPFTAIERLIQTNNCDLRQCGEAGNTMPLARYLAACVVLLAVACPSCLSVEVASPKNVLILHSFTLREDIDEVEVMETSMRSRVPGPVNFHVEYLESQRFGRAGYEKGLSETLSNTYLAEKLDLIVVYSYPALRFALDHRDQIFPGVPIVFTAVAPGRVQDRKLWPGVTGVTIPVDIPGTIDLALRVNPKTKNVAVVAGTSEFEQYWRAATDQAVRARAPSLQLIDIVGLPASELMERIGALPPNTAVLFELIPLDSSQPVMGTFDMLGAIAQHFPTYCIHNYCLDHGAVGGSYPDSDEQRVKAAELGARILAGEKPENIPVVHGSHVRAVVDWRQLRRWNPDESALPPGTILMYRQPTLWHRYEQYIVAGIVLLVLQALLIGALLWQRARKRKTEAILRESEKRFRVMADTTPSLVWMSDKDGKIFYQNQTGLHFTGDEPDVGSSNGWTAHVHPDDLQQVLAANSDAQNRRGRFSKEYRLRRADGVYRWMLDVAAPRVNGDGMFAGFIGSASDVTDQKLAQEALEKMGGRLIEAQEKERSRIARDLHDDICQRLALISLELEHALQGSNGTDARTKARIVDVQQHCTEVTGDLQALSHQLHSSKLDYLGLASALRSFCKEFSQQNVNLRFTDNNVPPRLPRDVSLCLFRVAQEALSNALKYSRDTQISVDLRGTEDDIRLEIRDAGVGFDVEEAKKHAGLGLVSMQERVHLVNGTFSIESKRNRGTTIVAIVPLKAADVSTFSASA
jgi:PAS domain S-box-containing protein